MTPIGCQEALQRLYEYLDGELTPDTTEEVRRHIDLCAGCYPEVRSATEFRDALHRAALGQPLCPDALRRKVAEMLREEGLSA
ncbi:MAG: zf-HC2 domain-containing protein [Gemmatimonadetes bacterium]|nr:zf-HC2 domain-containing protein [Gemmatimonadota bacterium]